MRLIYDYKALIIKISSLNLFTLVALIELKVRYSADLKSLNLSLVTAQQQQLSTSCQKFQYFKETHPQGRGGEITTSETSGGEANQSCSCLFAQNFRRL